MTPKTFGWIELAAAYVLLITAQILHAKGIISDMAFFLLIFASGMLFASDMTICILNGLGLLK